MGSFCGKGRRASDQAEPERLAPVLRLLVVEAEAPEPEAVPLDRPPSDAPEPEAELYFPPPVALSKFSASARALCRLGGKDPADRIESAWHLGCSFAEWYHGPANPPPATPEPIAQQRVWLVLEKGTLEVHWFRKRLAAYEYIAGLEDDNVCVVVGFCSQAELRAFHGGLGGDVAHLVEQPCTPKQ